MPRIRPAVSALRLAPWILAGGLFLSVSGGVIAQEGPLVPIDVDLDITTNLTELPGESPAGITGEGQSSTVASTGVGPGLAGGGTGPLSLGALVGAGVAALYALRERLRNR